MLAKKDDKKQQPQQSEKKPQQSKQTQPEKNSIVKSNASKLTPLQQKMKEKLSGARFRWLNEQLYTTKGDESFSLFKEKPELFDEVCLICIRSVVETWKNSGGSDILLIIIVVFNMIFITCSIIKVSDIR